MSAPRNIVIVCSYAPGFHKLLEFVRKRHPDDHVTAVFARGHVVTESEKKFLDDTIEAGTSSLSPPSGWWGLWRLSRVLCERNVDHLGFQYESFTLRLFGIASRPKECVAWLGNGQLLQLPLSVTASMSDLFTHRVRGYSAMLKAFTHAYLLRPTNEKPERPRR